MPKFETSSCRIIAAKQFTKLLPFSLILFQVNLVPRVNGLLGQRVVARLMVSGLYRSLYCARGTESRDTQKRGIGRVNRSPKLQCGEQVHCAHNRIVWNQNVPQGLSWIQSLFNRLQLRTTDDNNQS